MLMEVLNFEILYFPIITKCNKLINKMTKLKLKISWNKNKKILTKYNAIVNLSILINNKNN